jgi:hypothetical protein
MASKIPPHVARELRRHLAKQKPPPSGPGPTPGGGVGGDGNPSSADAYFSRPIVLAGCLALTATMTIVPYAFINWIRPLSERDDALTGSQIRRGAFNNSGSRDVGKDPYWDFRRGRRKRKGDDGIDDDGGYEDLFKRDSPGDTDLGKDEEERKYRSLSYLALQR